jgi:hypothetical protein
MVSMKIAKDYADVHLYPYGLTVPDEDFAGHVRYFFGEIQIWRSIFAQEPEDELIFRNLLATKPIRHAVEIGTCKGTSTALLAAYARHVTTFDRFNFMNKFPFWLEYKVHDKIESHVVNNEEKVAIIDGLDFDFAFIDGDHEFDGIAIDFEATKKCGRVLFHDYYIPGSPRDLACKWGDITPGVNRLVDSLPESEVYIEEPFALWTAGKGGGPW